ncbi:MAG: ribosome-associated translation inhibitor RaiA [Pirellulales bacterium]|nr:ribosome-associated translation inhibitor RaiA [Pirellulales bacterium]
MQIDISVRHGHVSEPTQDTIREKLDKLYRLYDRLSAISAIIDFEHRDQPVVELKASAKKHEFIAVGKGENLPSAVDEAINRMEQQLRKRKEKVQDRHRGAGHRE